MRRFVLVLVILVVCAIAAGAEDNSETLLYLGYGPVVGDAKVVCTDWKGNVLREVKVQGTPGSLCVFENVVYAAIPNTDKKAAIPKTGQLISINEEGEVYVFSFDKHLVADPISLAIRENPFEVFIADNLTDYVAGMTAEGKTRKYFANRSGNRIICQNMSIAITNELLVVATDYPRPGVYAVKLGDGTASRQRERLLERDGSVAAIRGTNRWVATQLEVMGMYWPQQQKKGSEAVHVFEGTSEVMRIPCPRGKKFAYLGMITSCGTNVIVAFKDGEGAYLYLLDLHKRVFVPMFLWKEEKGQKLAAIAAKTWSSKSREYTALRQ
ncbi:MAG: hypothetical protein U1C49_00470 [Candidatus Andersenbacteria bacterium]|nr:hypothetical protein [bacterium]MDZ4225299.1 hypothetical protein [Candidatus Andersenbacteria bacterium]